MVKLKEFQSLLIKFIKQAIKFGLFLIIISCKEDSIPVEKSELDKTIDLAASYLMKSTTDSGRFIYRINMDPIVHVEEDYNVLRHAGTIYAMADYRELTGNKKIDTSIIRASNYLKNTYIKPLEEHPELLALWSDKAELGFKEKDQAKLGGAGLALIALLKTEEVLPGQTDIDMLKRIGNFIILMQREDGSFFSKYIPHKGGRFDRWTSLFYPGEAAFGLALLYEKDKDQKWLNTGLKAVAYLAEIRKDKKNVESDHWALLATNALLKHYEKSDKTVSYNILVDHGISICESMLESYDKIPKEIKIKGCFSDDGRTTPTATKLEGLLAAKNFIPTDSIQLRNKIDTVISDGIQFLIKSQVKTGIYAGAIPLAIAYLPENHPKYKKTFNLKSTEVRIDYIQHALSAMINYKRQKGKNQ